MMYFASLYRPYGEFPESEFKLICLRGLVRNLSIFGLLFKPKTRELHAARFQKNLNAVFEYLEKVITRKLRNKQLFREDESHGVESN